MDIVGLTEGALGAWGSKSRAKEERGFLADVHEADNVVRRVFQRKMAALGLAPDEIF